MKPLRTPAVLLALALAASLAGPALAGTRTQQADIVQTARDAGQFKTLTKLLKRAGLVNTLRGDGPYTVFAPTDKAFAKVPKRTLDALARDKKKLKAVLLYHVVAGKVTAADVVELSKAETLNGADVRIRVRAGKVYVNKARVTKADVGASNGVIHVVNRVLIPPAD
jgi:uncharacterized surface protein with fasciclin (FAS1) repeats